MCQNITGNMQCDCRVYTAMYEISIFLSITVCIPSDNVINIYMETFSQQLSYS